MRNVFIVSKFTALETFKKKAFKITFIILLLLIIIAFNIPNIINLVKNNTDQDDFNETILVIDENNLYEGKLESLNLMQLGYNFEISNQFKDDVLLKEMLLNDEIEAAINVTEDESSIILNYITESIGLTGNILVDGNIFTELYKIVQLEKLGLTDEEIIKINAPIIFEVTELGDGDSGGILAVAMIFSLVLFFAIYYYAYQVSSSITVEKTSRVMDTLVTSTSPKSIVVGKTLGIGFVGLTQVFAIILTSFISYKLFFPSDILNGIIDISNINPVFILVTVIYFILGYTLYAFIYALTGSLVSKPEDVQQAGSLVAIFVLIGFYLAYFSMMNPASSFNTIATMLPLSSPFSVPARYITGAIGLLDLTLSIIILLVSIMLVAYIAIKIYSSASFNYGTKVNFKTMIEMFKQKEN
ncbi:MAG: ABC transporter permease [Bacilli bacterium]|nr:ABC transporter permease [Bacilli bacterium]